MIVSYRIERISKSPDQNKIQSSGASTRSLHQENQICVNKL